MMIEEDTVAVAGVVDEAAEVVPEAAIPTKATGLMAKKVRTKHVSRAFQTRIFAALKSMEAPRVQCMSCAKGGPLLGPHAVREDAFTVVVVTHRAEFFKRARWGNAVRRATMFCTKEGRSAVTFVSFLSRARCLQDMRSGLCESPCRHHRHCHRRWSSLN